MAIRINYNPMSVLTNANLAISNRKLTDSIGRLSSGQRIQTSADDPAALVVANAVRYYRTGIERAASNAAEGVNMLQTAEGSMDQITSILQHCRTLALNAASTATMDPAQLSALQQDLSNAIGSITTIAVQSSFAGTPLLDGTLRDASLSDAAKDWYSAMKLDWTKLPGGIQAGSDISINPASGPLTRSQAQQAFAPGVPGSTVIGLTGPVAITGPKGTATITLGATTTIDGAVAQINAASSITGVIANYDDVNGIMNVESTSFGNSNFSIASSVGGFLNSPPVAASDQILTVTYTDAAGAPQSMLMQQDANSPGGLTFTNVFGGPPDGTSPPYLGYAPGAISVTVKDTSGGGIGAQIPPATATFTAKRLSTAGIQIGALASQRVALEIPDMRAGALGSSAGLANSGFASLDDLVTSNALTTSQAGNALTVIDAALAEVLSARGSLGALQGNTVTPALDSLQTSDLNLTQFESTLRDTDMAKESAEYTRLQIMVQAATAMLAQANQVPQQVLQLLK